MKEPLRTSTGSSGRKARRAKTTLFPGNQLRLMERVEGEQVDASLEIPLPVSQDIWLGPRKSIEEFDPGSD